MKILKVVTIKHPIHPKRDSHSCFLLCRPDAAGLEIYTRYIHRVYREVYLIIAEISVILAC